MFRDHCVYEQVVILIYIKVGDDPDRPPYAQAGPVRIEAIARGCPFFDSISRLFRFVQNYNANIGNADFY